VAPDSITIRFADGTWEYVVTERVPKIGESLVRQGRTWVVSRVDASPDGNDNGRP
jgi:hypothetical protein